MIVGAPIVKMPNFPNFQRIKKADSFMRRPPVKNLFLNMSFLTVSRFNYFF